MSTLHVNLDNSAIATALNNKLDMDSLESRIDKDTMRVNNDSKIDVKEASFTTAGVAKNTSFLSVTQPVTVGASQPM